MRKYAILLAALAPLGCKEADVATAGHLAKARVDTARVQLRQLRNGVLRYQVMKGSPPATLDDLLKAKVLLGNRVPLDPWGEPYLYARGPSGDYQVSSKGPDRIAGTDDDVSAD